MGELITDYNADLQEKQVTAEDAVTQYLTFFIGGETFAVNILDVNEIIEVAEMTYVPMVPDFIRGVINLRGSVVPVVDLSARLGRGQSDITKRSCIVLVEIQLAGDRSQMVGMLVDAVNEIVEIEETNIQPPPNMGTDVRTEFIQAMGRVDETFMILLDINHVLSQEEIGQVEQLSQYQQGQKEQPAVGEEL